MNLAEMYNAVQSRYSNVATGTENDVYASRVAASFGYTKDDLDNIPKGANLGVSCGNPLAVAGLREGEVVVDLGCGAGFDVFLASRKVQASGKAIGVDMNHDMLAKANRNKDLAKAQNVEFIKAPITDLSPLQNGSTDCVISNCVINLVPEVEKQLVFNEMARILKPGGRVAVSDVLLKQDLVPDLKQNLALYVGCIAGASKVEDYESYLRIAGFKDVLITDTCKDLNVYKDTSLDVNDASCCSKSPSVPPDGCSHGNGNHTDSSTTDPAANIDFNEHAGAFAIYAMKT